MMTMVMKTVMTMMAMMKMMMVVVTMIMVMMVMAIILMKVDDDDGQGDGDDDADPKHPKLCGTFGEQRDNGTEGAFLPCGRCRSASLQRRIRTSPFPSHYHLSVIIC